MWADLSEKTVLCSEAKVRSMKEEIMDVMLYSIITSKFINRQGVSRNRILFSKNFEVLGNVSLSKAHFQLTGLILTYLKTHVKSSRVKGWWNTI